MYYETPWLYGNATGIVEIYDGKQWVSLIDPANMSISIYDLDSGEGAGRNQDGEMFRDRVAIKEKIEMSFPPMYRSDYAKILALIKDEFFKVRYFSDKVGDVRETLMHASDRKCTLYFGYDTSNNKKSIVKDISFNFIEK